VRIDYPRAGRTGLRHWLPSWRQWLALLGLGAAALVGAFALLVVRTDVPAPNDVATAQTTIVYWNDGTHELGRLGDANRIDVPLSAVPLDVQHAVLAAEDRGFYTEGGVSPTGIGRAIINDVKGGDLQGGSTITQQYAKNAYLTQDRTISRKLQELVLAVKLDTSVPKDQILEDYLNTIYFGRSAYGIQTASQQYFGTSVQRLDLGQAAALAAIIRSPGGYSPDSHVDKLKGRWNYVLDGMVQQGWITAAQRDAAVFPAFVKKHSVNRFKGPNGYLLDSVRTALLAHGFSDDDINRGGLRVTSTFDRTAQAASLAAVNANYPTSGTKGLRVGLVAIKPGTGEVVAMYGGGDFLTSPVNNATQAIGQAGSTFKPFALAAAVEQGISLDSTWNGNSGITIDGYKVNNESDRSWGRISLLKGMEQSVNSVYVGVSSKVGYDKVVDAAERAGLPKTTPALGPVRSVALGVASPHVIDMADAYATFAARGQHVDPSVLLKVVGGNGGVLYELNPSPSQVFTSDVADTVNFALRKVVTDGTGQRALALGRPAAGKTGTTNDNKSAWFVGYTPDLAAAVMFVKDGPDGKPTTLSGVGGMSLVTGGSYPTRIWTAFMKAALGSSPVQQFVDPTSVPTDVTGPTATASSSATATPSSSPTASPSSSTAAPSSPSAAPSPTAPPTSASATPAPTTATSAASTPTATAAATSAAP
jgi:membrane peptidoglycan carboxypeptidase